MFSVGIARNDFQSHRFRTLLPLSMVNSQRSRDMCGVGPADNTGKSAVRYCPGGSLASAALRRPAKPREMIPIETPGQRLTRFDVFYEPIGTTAIDLPINVVIECKHYSIPVCSRD